MTNANTSLRTSTKRVGTTSLNGCHLLPSHNSSLAAHWENIPETALLNGVIGAILFILFLILTKVAWRRHGKDDRLAKQNIISFLYGYRDPEHWYLIPRFEFLRAEDKHHHHDLQCPYLYVPPKLPLANPIEVFGFDSDMGLSKSRESNEDPTTKQSKSPPRGSSPQSDIKSAKTMPVGSPNSSRNQPLQKQQQQEQQPQQLPCPYPQTPTSPKNNRRANDSGPLHQSFYYPSILQAEQRQASWLSRKLNSFFSKFFRATDADIIYAKGIDAYEYLLFQRHLILLMFFTNIICLGVIFPIHWTNGSNEYGNLTTSFQRSTIKNMGTTTNYYWVHISCSVLIVTCALFILKSYKQSILTRSDPQVSRRTILVGNIPQEQRSRPVLLNVLNEYFPSVTVEAIQFVYDTNKLADYQQDLSSVMVAKDYCTYYKHIHKKELMVRKTDVNTSRYCNGNCRLCSFLLICCCYWPCESKEPGTIYYTKQEQKCREQIAELCKTLVDEPTEYAFVTFKSHRQAKRVMHELAQFKQEASEDKQISPKARNMILAKSIDSTESNQSIPKPIDKILQKNSASNQKSKFLETTANETQDPLDPTNNPHIRSIRSPIQLKRPNPKSNLTRDTIDSPAALRTKGSKDKTKSKRHEGPLTWSIRYAPHPDNVGFRDLLFLAKASKFTTALLHFLMIIIFVFITTPNVVLSMIERADILQPNKAKQLTGFQGLIINYLSISIQIITTALLPSLITQISKQIPYEDASSKDHSVMWKVYLFLVLMIIILPSIGMSSAQALLSSDIDPKCLFPTDNGAYFINYVISSIFISTIFELIKPSDILYYYVILFTSRSTAELEGGRQFIDSEFPIGLHHTNVLLIFSVVMTYSISCPLIAPFGLIYLLVKHSVDHYHLYYSYFTKKVDRNLQGTIVIFVRVALLLMLFQTTVAISINTGTSYFSLVSQIVFWITLAGCMFNCFMDCTSRTLPSTKRNRFQQEFCACFYLPRVIQDLLKCDAIPASCISRKV